MKLQLHFFIATFGIKTEKKIEKKKEVLFFDKKRCTICLFNCGCRVFINFSLASDVFITPRIKTMLIWIKKPEKTFLCNFLKNMGRTFCATCTATSYPCLYNGFCCPIFCIRSGLKY